MVENFVGICITSNAKFEAVEALAKVSGWEQPPDEYLPLIAPQATPTKWNAWMSDEDGELLLVGASRAPFRGEPTDSCVVAGKTTQAELDAALAAFRPQLIDEINEVVQLTRVYSIDRLGNQMLVMVVSEPGASSGLFIVSASDIPDEMP